MDDIHMAHALTMGRRAQGRVWPWPAVGCVIVNEGRVVGRGYSDQATLQHAETMALAQAGTAARGATAYVTLEPCAHHGTTPPCANALVAAGIKRVVAACDDPNPQVAGKGFDILRAAGIAVTMGVHQAQARWDHAGFLKVQTNGLPFVTLKLALTLDGRIATATGESRWITGPAARRAVHAMRARHDAVLVGAGTARADDPMLDVRDMGALRQPVRIVAARELNLPSNSRLVRSADVQPLWLCHGTDADAAPWQALGAKTIPCETTSAQIDPENMMRQLANAGLTRIFCEGGGALAASLLAADLVDAVEIFTAGKFFGGDGRPGVAGFGLDTLSEAPVFDLHHVQVVGDDVRHTWRHRRHRCA